MEDYHFPIAYKTTMPYSQFLDEYDKEQFPGQIVMKDDSFKAS